ncbi:hypothetical protein PIB30_101113, partial [Stylosanthes scabra]|nr:hypothetical protein [Stylosanthes scabra]
ALKRLAISKWRRGSGKRLLTEDANMESVSPFKAIYLKLQTRLLIEGKNTKAPQPTWLSKLYTFFQ